MSKEYTNSKDESLVWAAPAIGVIGDFGGSKSEETSQGLFSIGDIGISLYGGGILGLGSKVGLYGTAGLIIGDELDVGIGGGVHFGKVFGLGVIFPIFGGRNKDISTASAVIENVTNLYHSTQVYAMQAIEKIDGLTGGLEKTLTLIT